MTGRFSLTILMLVVLVGYQPGSSQKTTSARPASFNGFDLVDKTGNIRKPADFRDHYELLGAWWVADPTGPQLHITYASPGAAEYYRKNGKFADGAVMVKEIMKTDHAKMTTGDVHW